MCAMYVHVRKAEDLETAEIEEPLGLLAAGRATLVHSECVGGEVAIEDGAETLTLVCGKCEARQPLEREEVLDALRRVLSFDEYAWAGDAGFLPD